MHHQSNKILQMESAQLDSIQSLILEFGHKQILYLLAKAAKGKESELMLGINSHFHCYQTTQCLKLLDIWENPISNHSNWYQNRHAEMQKVCIEMLNQMGNTENALSHAQTIQYLNQHAIGSTVRYLPKMQMNHVVKRL